MTSVHLDKIGFGAWREPWQHQGSLLHALGLLFVLVHAPHPFLRLSS